MNVENCLVSIIMNCHNGEKYLKSSLNSILNQTHNNWELIFYDNASNDFSKDLFFTYSEPRFKYFSSQNKISLGAARSHAVNFCKGVFICFLDVDDVWLPDKLNIQIKRMLKENSDLSYGGIIEIYPNSVKQKKVLPRNKGIQPFRENLLNFELHLQTLMIRRSEMLKKNLNFDPYIEASEEYCFGMQFLINSKITVINDVLAKYLIRNDSLTNVHIARWAIERRYTLNKILKNNPDFKLIYSKEFDRAYLQSDYYEYRYLMSTKKYKLARNVIKKGMKTNAIFFIFYLLSNKYFAFIFRTITKYKYKR